MDKLDEILKLKANNEKEFIPDSLDNKINNILNNLSSKKSKKPIIAAGLAAALISAPLLSVYGSDIPIVKEVIGYFNKNDNSYYIGEKNAYEKYAQNIGIAKEDKGIKVTINQVYCDDNYISVFYTVEGRAEDKLNKRRNLHSSLDIDFNGYQHESGIYLEENVDESGKIQGVFRRAVTQSEVLKNFNLKVDFNMAYEVEGNWNFEFEVNKQDEVIKYTKEYKPDVEAKVTNRSVHEIDIEKVVLSPSGNRIVISEKDMGLEPALLRFVVYDDKDNLLGVLEDEGGGGLINSYKFPTIKSGAKSLKLVPIINPGTPKTIGPQTTVDVKEVARYFYNIINVKDSFPKKVQAPSGGNIIINKIVSTNEGTEVYFQKENLYNNPSLQIINENDEVIIGKYNPPVLVDSNIRMYKEVLPMAKDNYKLLISSPNEVELDDIPKEVKVSDKGSIKVTKIERTEKSTKVYYQKDGLVLGYGVYMSMINSNGDLVDGNENLLDDVTDYEERLVDKENGVYMQVFPKSEDSYRLAIWDEEKLQLDYNQAITIPLK